MLKKKLNVLVVAVVLFLLCGNKGYATLSDLIQQHIHYGQGEGNQIFTLTPLKSEQTSEEFWNVLSDAESLYRTDVIKMLEHNSERKKNLNAYLLNGDRLMIALSYHKNSLTRELQQVQEREKECRTSLDLANRDFSQALKSNNEALFYATIEEAKESRRCLGEKWVEKSALQNLLNKVNFYSQQIKPKVDYLNKNQNLILKHYDILKPSLLSELYKISVRLQVHK